MRRFLRLFITFIVMFIAIMSVSYAQTQWTQLSGLKTDYQQEMKGEGCLMIDDYTEPFINVVNNYYNTKATFYLYSVCDINNYPFPYDSIDDKEETLGTIIIKDSPYLLNISYKNDTHIILKVYKGIGERYDLSGTPFYRQHQLIDEYHSVGITDEEVVRNIIAKMIKLK